jgi:membrane protein implicated in regulation of membrane protease activity
LLYASVRAEATIVAAYWIWWAMGGVLVAVELLTGTIYLLAVGVAFAAGGVAAWLGASHAAQLLAASVVGVVGVFAAHRWRRTRAPGTPDASYDVGQPVQVRGWQPDGTARVSYRGTLWSAVPESPDTPRAETMYVVGMRGTSLVVSDRKP